MEVYRRMNEYSSSFGKNDGERMEVREENQPPISSKEYKVSNRLVDKSSVFANRRVRNLDGTR